MVNMYIIGSAPTTPILIYFTIIIIYLLLLFMDKSSE
uniref:Uncharacterized protein n=1 Tax=Picea glauca TaxID=3330 RepID=A0A117NHR6_PICGL|nr:hypothetical protein ABT39_MTgene4149 [Picea glauca]